MPANFQPNQLPTQQPSEIAAGLPGRPIKWALIVFLLLCCPAVALSQESDQESELNSGETPQATRAEFDATSGEWREVMKKLRKARFHFGICEEHESEQYRQDYLTQVAKGDKLFVKLIDQGCELLYQGPDREIEGMLDILQQKYFDQGNYELTLKIGMALLQNNPTDFSDMINLSYVARYCNEFETAKELIKMIEAGTGSPAGPLLRSFLAAEPRLTADWNAELAIRAEEDKAANLPRVLISTSQGDILVELFANEAPNTVANFLELAKNGIYDNTRFYEAAKDRGVKGGSPFGDGRCSVEHLIGNEGRANNARKHYRGTLCMVALGDKGQFTSSVLMFCRVANPSLNGNYTAFGRVIKGQEYVDFFKNSHEKDSDGALQPVDDFEGDLIHSIEIVREPVEPMTVIRQAPDGTEIVISPNETELSDESDGLESHDDHDQDE